MKRIGIDCRFWGIKHAGLGRYTRELTLAILRIKSNFKFTLFFQTGEYQQDKKLLADCHIIELNIPHYSLKEQIQLWWHIDKEQLDFIHYPHFNLPVMSKTAFIVTIHDLIKHYFRGRMVTTKNQLVYWTKYGGYRFVVSYAVKNAKKIIAPSEFTKNQLLDYYPKVKGKISVIYEGVARPYGENHNFQDKAKIFEQYQLDRPYFIYTGSAYPSKDIPTLLKAFRQINSENKYLLLLSCARNHFRQKLQITVNDYDLNNSVLLPGSITDQDLARLYQHAVAFVIPSLMEGFGLPGLEAIASSCPVISSRAGSLPEIYGQAAVYFKPGDDQELARKMQFILNLKKAERDILLNKGKKHSQKFTWDKAAVQTLAVYQSLEV